MLPNFKFDLNYVSIIQQVHASIIFQIKFLLTYKCSVKCLDLADKFIDVTILL